MNPLVSVIIPCYKYARFLPDAIESCLRQTYKNIEVIVVNDASPDNTKDVALHYPVCLVEHEVNKGVGAARNTGCRAAVGDWFVCLDADDVLAPTFIERLLREDADIVGCNQQEFGSSTVLWQLVKEPEYEQFYIQNQTNCSALHRRKVWEACGGWIESRAHNIDMCSDWEFWLRATYLGFKVKNVGESLFYYRKHGHSMTDTVNPQARFEELRKRVLQSYKRGGE